MFNYADGSVSDQKHEFVSPLADISPRDETQRSVLFNQPNPHAAVDSVDLSHSGLDHQMLYQQQAANQVKVNQQTYQTKYPPSDAHDLPLFFFSIGFSGKYEQIC